MKPLNDTHKSCKQLTNIGNDWQGEGNPNNCKEDAEQTAGESFGRNVAVTSSYSVNIINMNTTVHVCQRQNLNLIVRPIVVRMVVEKKTAWM